MEQNLIAFNFTSEIRSTARTSKTCTNVSLTNSKVPVENTVVEEFYQPPNKRKKLKRRMKKKCVHDCQIGDHPDNPDVPFVCTHKMNNKGVCECMIRRRKWLIADIANYLSKRLHDFLKYESDVLSCATKKS